MLHQYALGLAQVDAAGAKAMQDGLNSSKCPLWHGNAKRAVKKTTDLDDALATHQEDLLVVKK